MSEEEKKEQVAEYEPGEFAACIANCEYNVIKLAQDAKYRAATPAGVIPGRIVSKAEHNTLIDPKSDKTQRLTTYVFEALNEKGEPHIDQKSGRPMHIELPGHSIFKTPKQAVDFLLAQSDLAAKEFATKVNNSCVDADKVLNIVRKVKVAGNVQLVK